jgi:hypothetical protein
MTMENAGNALAGERIKSLRPTQPVVEHKTHTDQPHPPRSGDLLAGAGIGAAGAEAEQVLPRLRPGQGEIGYD